MKKVISDILTISAFLLLLAAGFILAVKINVSADSKQTKEIKISVYARPGDAPLPLKPGAVFSNGRIDMQALKITPAQIPGTDSVFVWLKISGPVKYISKVELGQQFYFYISALKYHLKGPVLDEKETD